MEVCNYKLMRRLLTFTDTRLLFFRTYVRLINRHADCNQRKQSIVSNHGISFGRSHRKELEELRHGPQIFQQPSKDCSKKLDYYMQLKADCEELEILQPLIEQITEIIDVMREGFVTKHVNGERYADGCEFQKCLKHFHKLSEDDFKNWQLQQSHDSLASLTADAERMADPCIRFKYEQDRLREKISYAATHWKNLCKCCGRWLETRYFQGFDETELAQRYNEAYAMISTGEYEAMDFRQLYEDLELCGVRTSFLDLKLFLRGLSEFEILNDQDIERTLP